jgi:hypothetical protein
MIGKEQLVAADGLVEAYRPVGQMKGGELLLRHADALRFLEDCKVAGVTVLGMDFFAQAGTDIVQTPSSADYSSISHRPDAAVSSTREALALIRDGFPNGACWVTFVLEDPAE